MKMAINHINLFRNVFYNLVGGGTSALIVSYILGYRIEKWVTMEFLIYTLVGVILMFLFAFLFENILSYFGNK